MRESGVCACNFAFVSVKNLAFVYDYNREGIKSLLCCEKSVEFPHC